MTPDTPAVETSPNTIEGVSTPLMDAAPTEGESIPQIIPVKVYDFVENGTDIKVENERWRWVAIYNDQTSLQQFDDDTGRFHAFKEIDQTKLHAFLMVSDVRPPIVMLWKPGRKLVHFYNHTCLAFGEPQEQRIKLYYFGYEEEGKTRLLAIMPDDSIAFVDSTNDITFGAPQA